MRHVHVLICPLLLALASSTLTVSAVENEQRLRLLTEARQYAITKGLLKGIVDIEIIRDDIVEVTLDGAIIGDHSSEEGEMGQALGGLASDLQKPEAFIVKSETAPGFADGVRPTTVSRDAYEFFNAKDVKGNWKLVIGNLTRNDYYLALPTPLVPGHEYTVTVEGGAPDISVPTEQKFSYNDQTTTKVIKVNSVGYSAQADRRYGYLGWWIGDGGAVDYSGLKTFDVIDEKSGETALSGDITPRREADELSGENISELDLSKLGPGTYHVRVPGLANSDTFTVGGENVFETYYHTMRAFFHQRCGQELGKPFTAVTKAACHTDIFENGEFANGTGVTGLQEVDIRQPELLGPQGEMKTFRGGYHDAADFDNFTYHLPATGLTLIAYEFSPATFPDSQLNIPESGNGIPDVLDEAQWALGFYLEQQLPSGAVPLGRANLQDAIRQNFEKDRELYSPPFGILPPSHNSGAQFAASAAQFARLMKTVKPDIAAKYLEGARKAFAYSSTRTAKDVWQEHRNEKTKVIYREKDEESRPSMLLWAACELFAATGDEQYESYIAEHYKAGGYWDTAPQAFWSYLKMPEDRTLPAAREHFMNAMTKIGGQSSKKKLERLEEAGYRMSNGNEKMIGWGRANGVSHAANLMIAYGITGDKTYYDAACLNYDFTCGVNPISKSHITSMGARYPTRPEISMFLYLDKDAAEIYGDTIRGFTIYGFGPPMKMYPGPGKDGVKAEGHEAKGWPLWRSWRDVWSDRAEIYSEFTISQTIGPSAFTAAMIYADAVKAGQLSPDQKPKFPLGARSPASLQ